MLLRIIKPKTRPVPIEPWLFRYLTTNELKLVGAILTYADYKDRSSNSFPSNKTLAFFCGFDLIEKPKALEKFKALSKEEQIKFKAQKIKYSINTVKAIKRALVKKGILKTELRGEKGKQSSYMTLDLLWKKEQYLKDHDEFFNNSNSNDDNEAEINEEISNELEEITRLLKDGEVSKESLATRLKNLSYALKREDSSDEIPVEDVEKVADYVMNTNKIVDKIDKGEISDKEAYKKSIISNIKKNQFNGAKEYYQGLIQREKEDIFNNILFGIEHQESTIPYKKQILKFNNIDLKDGIYYSNYISEFGQVYNFLITDKQLKYYLPLTHTYTKQNKEFLENYQNNVLNYLEKNKLEKYSNDLMNIPISSNQ
ncbi:MAG: hypothetical protein KA157_10795 [Aliarcobacter sp.]|jgi:hypothetical protein|nr:hypothetical protein [Aliarcobacter sp.]